MLNSEYFWDHNFGRDPGIGNSRPRVLDPAKRSSCLPIGIHRSLRPSGIPTRYINGMERARPPIEPSSCTTTNHRIGAEYTWSPPSVFGSCPFPICPLPATRYTNGVECSPPPPGISGSRAVLAKFTLPKRYVVAPPRLAPSA